MRFLLIFILLFLPLVSGGVETLELVKEQKVSKLLGKGLEPSGVAAHGKFYYVIFDAHRGVARLHNQLSPDPNSQWNGEPSDEGFEGITYDEETDRFYTVVEITEERRSKVVSYDGALVKKSEKPLDRITFEDKNKGFEGIGHIRKHDELYLLLLCEGNKCKKGGKRGRGKIRVFHERNNRWQLVDRINLPRKVDFEDYSGLDIRGNKIAVTSQEDSKLWIGKLRSRGDTPETIDFWIQGKSKTYQFHEDRDKYCNIEGISFLNDDSFVVVSDKRKKDEQPKSCSDKDQSVHVFVLPDT